MVYFARKAARFPTADDRSGEVACALLRIAAFCEAECAQLLALIAALDSAEHDSRESDPLNRNNGGTMAAATDALSPSPSPPMDVLEEEDCSVKAEEFNVATRCVQVLIGDCLTRWIWLLMTCMDSLLGLNRGGPFFYFFECCNDFVTEKGLFFAVKRF
jgi:hypothetical protein